MGTGNRRQSRHLRWAAFLFAVDFLIVWASFIAGIFIRFGSVSWEKLLIYGPGIAIASLVMPSILYIGGLYSTRHFEGSWISSLRWMGMGFAAVIAAVLVVGSLDFSSRVGRGVLFASILTLFVGLLVRHAITMGRRRLKYRTFLCLVTGETDETAAEKLFEFWSDRARTFGVVSGSGYQPRSSLPFLGVIDAIRGNDSEIPVEVVLVRDRHFSDPALSEPLRGLRYDGAEILPISDACEDAYHAVPLELITDAWLFRASNQSQLFYVRKLKRLSDIFLSVAFMILLAPFFLVGALLVKLSSPGPLIFKQDRAGRFGKPFKVLKLRTMHVASDQVEAKWADQERARIFPIGVFLRKFRVDEIPQLINVLRGEMSFVGPRPEQMQFVEDLSKVLPFYRERLLIQPGITGWAQVNYPYGASVEDAARKLEYDFYYMKHMGIFFDFFILLETIKTILKGGVRNDGDDDYLNFRKDMDLLREELKLKTASPSQGGP